MENLNLKGILIQFLALNSNSHLNTVFELELASNSNIRTLLNITLARARWRDLRVASGALGLALTAGIDSKPRRAFLARNDFAPARV